MKKRLNDLELIEKYRDGAFPDCSQVDDLERLMLLRLLEVKNGEVIKSTPKGVRLLKLA